MGIHRRAEAAEENQIEMEQRNEAAREVIQGVRQDGRYSEGQEAVEGFYRGWLAEAQQVQQDDKYYTLDQFSNELWVTTKQFEDDLKTNHNRYEQRLTSLKKDHSTKVQDLKASTAFYLEAQASALTSCRLEMRTV